ncbi:MAG: DUF1883 domain-containing protein [Clostridiales Family XIII bacterium]|jgi:hypothetical protein|nr:DUF1883 domain-containing protein [Clostridiales Family XIII bacterium]
MKYLAYDLGTAEPGDTVEVTLGYAANVRILNSDNYALYKENAAHRFTGGFIERSPYKFVIPEAGQWYVTIDSGSYFGKIKALVKLKPPANAAAQGRAEFAPDPEICELAPAKKSAAADSPAAARSKLKIFLLHHHKDSESIALPLAESLSTEGFSVFYEDFELEPGESLGEKLKNGVTKYRFGVVVISRAFIRTGWRTSDILYLKELLKSDYQEIYPLWHGITKTDAINHVVDLAELVPDKLSAFNVEEATAEITRILGH